MTELRLDAVSHAVREPSDQDDGLSVRNLSLSVPTGQFVALVGRNGSGKTTVARLMNGLLLPVRGTVTVDGLTTSSPEERWEVRRRVGLVFQNPDHQIVASVVEEEVAFGPENFGVPAAEVRERVARALSATHLTPLARRSPHSLSGGQKQRLAIASLLALEPAFMVLDEPTSMLDPEGRAEVLGALVRLHRERGLAIVLITHSMEEACLAERIVVLARGEVTVDTTPAALFADAGQVAALGLEAPPMARLAGHLRSAGLSPGPDALTVPGMLAWLQSARQPRQAG